MYIHKNIRQVFVSVYQRLISNILFKKLVLLIILLAYNSVYSQLRTISGQVLDSFQSPVVGASIIEESDKTNGTVSDFDGNFLIKLNNKNSNLIISYLGFKDQIISTIGIDNINIVLEEDFENLDEITVVAYGKQKKSSVIASNLSN